MLQAGLGIAAALAFVLALGAFCLWALKRWGTGTLLPRSRVPVEVVQRIALGPKVGLAVVRVGEKVMAVSIGEGGVRTLFELDEADRQHILATSTVPVPLNSSTTATADFARFLPGVFSGVFGRTREPELDAASLLAPIAAPVVFAPSGAGAGLRVPALLTTSAGQALTYTRAAHTAVAADRDFRAMLGVSLSGATRLMVLIGALAIAGGVVSPLRAQVAAPVAPPVAPRVTPPSATSPSATSPSATSPSATSPSAAAPRAAAPSAAASATAAVGADKTSPTAARSLQDDVRNRLARPAATQTTAKGNGASITPGDARSTQPTSRMVVDSAASDSTGAGGASAEDAIMRMMPQMDMKIGDAKDGGLRLNGTVGIVVMMGLLTLLPTLLLMMTGFTRILIVLHFLKQAMGTQGAPPAQLLAGLALLLTGFVMAPTFTEVNRDAITPWMDGRITQVEMMKTAVKPMRGFMLRQVRNEDLKSFVELSRTPQPNTVDDVPLQVLMSAFVASELRTSFQIGFMIYLPFIIIDAVVASVLMSMGMMMLPPAMISLPFKLLLFVLVDGWALTIQSLVQSFK